MLRTRVLSAVVLLPVVAVVVYFGGWLFAVVMAVVAGLAGYEFYQLLRKAEFAPNIPLGLLMIAALVLSAAQPALERWAAPALTLLLMLSLVWHMLQKARPAPGSDWMTTVAGALYLGWLCSRFVALRQLPNGMYWLILALVSTWITDSAAYFVGRRWGRRKLAPRLSPKKTWEGAIGGWLIGVALTPAVAWLLGLPPIHGLGIGILTATVAPFGDLAESMFKRQAGVKDSSNLIPGHGGMLDRIDSLLFVVPAAFYYVVLLALA
jgi:phosphatidate cytidylyltransferase